MKMWREGNPCVLPVAMEIGRVTTENSMAVSKKLKMKPPYRSNNTTSGYLSEGNEITILKGYLHSYGHWNIIYTSQDMEAI